MATDTFVAPHDLEAESNVLGAVMVSDTMGALLNDVHLAPEHFYGEKNRRIFRACCDLYEQGKTPDIITVADKLRDDEEVPRDYISVLPNSVAAPGNVLFWAEVVQDHAVWRHRLNASYTLQEAVRARDVEKLATAETMLTEQVVRSGSTYGPAELHDLLWNHLEGEKPDIFPWPFEDLNQQTGGINRGEFVLLGGWTSHGKSVFLDQHLETVAKRNHRCHLYINEMMELQRVARMLSRKTGVSFNRIMAATLDDGDMRKVLEAANSFPFGITNCTGWTAEEIAYHIRRNRWDFVGVDILHEIEYQDEADLRHIASVFNRATKLANCSIVATVHLNEHRAHRQQRPMPVLSDIRGSGMMKNAADFVAFVYLFPHEDGSNTDEGAVWVAKGRNTTQALTQLRLEGPRFRWLLRD